MRNPLAGIVLLLLTASFAFAQQGPRTHAECIKQVPGDWGPNFGDEWHQNEALYWACRDGVAVSTVEAWQKGIGEYGMAQEITVVGVKGKEFVLFIDGGGSANCYGLNVLRKAGSQWRVVWTLSTENGADEGEYCAGSCPALKAHLSGETLTVQSPETGDDNCRRYRWHVQRFRWTGMTFVRLK
jgi:hypothetical protein